MRTEGRHLYRSNDSMIAGVCAGIAEYFGVDPTLIRVLAVLIAFLSFGAAVFAYLVLMICVPKTPDRYSDCIDVDPVESHTMNASEDRRGCPSDPREERGRAASPVAPPPPPRAATASEAGTSAQGRTDPMSGDDAATRPASMDNPTPGAAYSANYGAAFDTTYEHKDKKSVKPLIVVGVVFIVIGLINLLNQFFPAISWWAYWPLLLAAIGVYKMIGNRKHPWSIYRFLSGVLILLVALLLFACTTGMLGWGVWISVLSYWPMLLIALGCVVISSAVKVRGLKVLGSVIVLAMMAFGVYGYYIAQAQDSEMLRAGPSEGATGGVSQAAGSTAGNPATLAAGTQMKKVPLDSYDNATLAYNASASEIRIRAGVDNTVTVNGSSELLEKMSLSMTCGNKVANVRVDGGTPVGIVADAGVARTLLSTQTNWKTISSTTNWCDEDIDLTGVKVNEVKLTPTFSDVKLKLGAPTTTSSSITVNSNASGFSLMVPQGVQVAVSCDGSGIDLSSDGELTWDDARQVWCSDGYTRCQAEGTPCWTVTLHGALTKCDVETVSD